MKHINAVDKKHLYQLGKKLGIPRNELKTILNKNQQPQNSDLITIGPSDDFYWGGYYGSISPRHFLH